MAGFCCCAGVLIVMHSTVITMMAEDTGSLRSSTYAWVIPACACDVCWSVVSPGECSASLVVRRF